VLGGDCEIETHISSESLFLITVGQIQSSEVRERIFRRLTEMSARVATIVSPRARLARGAKVGEGTIVMHDTLINSEARVGKNCIINSKALIEHGAEIGDHSHVATGAIVNGDTRIGDRSFIGSHATIRQGLTLPGKTFVNAGMFYDGK
jgi:sugar O-acyltransferase (sialic acid O-acetyltransferase NeuD family)